MPHDQKRVPPPATLIQSESVHSDDPSPGRKEIDASGYWSVVVDEEPRKFAVALRDAGCGQSYDDDERHFRSLLQRELNGRDLTRYHAFEADLTLGGGTICETYPYNVVIFYGRGPNDFHRDLADIAGYRRPLLAQLRSDDRQRARLVCRAKLTCSGHGQVGCS